jgi:hypothetical protein
VETPSPPYGRLSALRETINVMCNIGNSYELHQISSGAFSHHAESNHRWVHLAARHMSRRVAGLVSLLIAGRETL